MVLYRPKTKVHLKFLIDWKERPKILVMVQLSIFIKGRQLNRKTMAAKTHQQKISTKELIQSWTLRMMTICRLSWRSIWNSKIKEPMLFQPVKRNNTKHKDLIFQMSKTSNHQLRKVVCNLRGLATKLNNCRPEVQNHCHRPSLHSKSSRKNCRKNSNCCSKIRRKCRRRSRPRKWNWVIPYHHKIKNCFYNNYKKKNNRVKFKNSRSLF